MKKSLLFAVVAVVMCFTGCSLFNISEPSLNLGDVTPTEQEEEEQEKPEEKELYTGKDAGVNANYKAKPFSVSEDKKIYFAQGNLQYQASTGIWQFAEDQYESLSPEANALVSSTNSGWIDMFGWGTSGYNGKYPYMTSKVSTDYGDGINDISGTDYDWGLYNPIRNGGNQKGLWRTMTFSEWEYICDLRPNAANLRGYVKVDTINGYILLPDEFIMPEGMTLDATVTNFTTNMYTMNQWKQLEALGAVLLPATGWLKNGAYNEGCYWLGTCGYGYNIAYELIYHDNMAFEIFFQDKSEVRASMKTLRAYGLSVRLVQDVK